VNPTPVADVGVALLNLGGPWSLDGIRPFLMELFADREIIRLSPFPFLQPLVARMIVRSRIREVIENYRLIGGRSPLLRTTVAQGAALEAELARRGVRARVLPAMRYANPRAGDAVASFRRAGCTRGVALTLYPHYSMATTGSSLNDLARNGDGLPWLPPVREYPDHPKYVEALANTVRQSLRKVSASRRDGATILFSAHGLPRHFIDDGDPYVDHIERTKSAVMARLNVPNPVRLSFQSRAGPVKWLEPDTGPVLEEMGAAGVKAVVVVPISFVSDHIETLFEIEMLYGSMAKAAGIEEFVRVPALNADPVFIGALADMVEERL
jgi:protoporphyrin/coproporphyrin ferrochelatase